MKRQKNVLEILKDLKILYHDLNRLIVEYDAIREWELVAFHNWKGLKGPSSLIGYQNQIYACFWKFPSSFAIYNPNGIIMKKKFVS